MSMTTMRSRNLFALACISLSALSTLPACFWGKSTAYNRYSAQSRYAADIWPAELEVPRAPHDEVQAARVRVWVDQDYRRGPSWRKRALHLVARANAFLAPAFGVRLEATFEAWERQAGGEDLAAVLDELAAHDAGDGVEWVIGMTGAPATFTVSHHELGRAHVLGKHFVVRDMNDAEEARQLARVLDTLDEDERLALYAARKHHKELVVFLHEWAHTVGGLHERGDGRIMAPAYGAQAATLSDGLTELVELGLELRAERGEGEAAEARREALRGKMRQVLADGGDEWWADERAQLEGLLGGSAGGAGTAGEGGRARVPAAAAKTYDRAVDAARAGRWQEAWAELAPIAEAYPRVADIQRVACALAVEGVQAPEAAEGCERLLAIYAGEARTTAEAWEVLASQLLFLGRLTRAEAALERAGDGERAVALRAQALVLRRRAGLPPDGARVGVPVGDEPAYLERFLALYDDLAGGDAASVVLAVGVALERWPDAPGLLALSCGAHMAAGKRAQAVPLCQRAVAGWSDAVLGHFYLAQLVKERRAQIAAWERVVDLDPEQRVAWRRLAELYRLEKRDTDRSALEERYRARFGEPL
jgi:tetratricopeptide (TPR) repeat protein